jgi:acylphosphatase
LSDGAERASVSDDRTRAHVFVSGHVQGVAYRANTRDTARERGVDGWVRNLDDGRVEAVFEGPASTVEGMVEWCHTGSPRAEVDDVSVEYGDPAGIDGFSVRW